MPSTNATVTSDGDFISPVARKISAADSAPTILARTRILSSKLTAAQVAKACGITESRFDLIERGAISATAAEQSALRKTLSSSSPVLFEKQTSESRAQETSRF